MFSPLRFISVKTKQVDFCPSIMSFYKKAISKHYFIRAVGLWVGFISFFIFFYTVQNFYNKNDLFMAV